MPAENEGFELVFWREGQDPLAQGFGLASPTNQSSVVVDLASLDANPNHPLEPGDYLWGVRLVQRDPYQKLQFLGGGFRFRFDREGGGGGGDDGGGGGVSSGE